MRSRGLGRKELVMDFREYQIEREGDEVVVTGTIREPVNWDFTIRINGDDIPGMLRLGLHRHTLAMAVRWAFRRTAKAPSAPEAPAVVTGPRPAAVSPRAVVRDSGAGTLPVARSPAPVAASPRSESRSKSGAKTPDFGSPRRRGAANGRQAPATEVVGEGGRR
jgi:hypothetical protein